MAYYRMRPPIIKQALRNSCWAAALDSFSRVTSGVPHLREADLVSRFGDPSDDGGLSGPKLLELRAALRRHDVRVRFIHTLVMPYDIEDRLRRSHVIIAYHVSSGDWHAWLIYGIDNYLIYLDPADGDLHKRHWATDFASDRGYYVFWHNL